MVVRAVVQYTESPVNLLCNNKPYQLVRKYQFRQRPYLFSLLLHPVCYPIRPAYQYHYCFHALVHTLLKLFCPLRRTEHFAPLI